MFGRYMVSNAIYILIYIWYNKKLFLSKEKKRTDIIIILSLIILKSCINLYSSFQLNLIVTLLTYTIISIKFFIGSHTKKFVFIGFYIITSLISEIISFLILKSILPDTKLIFNSILYNMIGSVLSTAFLFIFIYIVTKVNDIKDMVDNKEFWYFITFPIISIIIIYSIMHSNMLIIDPVLSILITFGIIFFNIVICIGFTNIIKSRNIQIENEKLKSEKLHYELFEEKFDNSRRFIHDFKKHINLINSYINSGKYSELKLYLGEVYKEIKKDENFVITGNQIIDLALNSNKDILSNYQICIRHDVKIRELKKISTYDFNIVFSNILENAIESCINSNGHFIKIKLDEHKNLIILKVINPCTYVKKNFESMKSNVEYHGCGIKNIKKIVDKYNGLSTFKYDSNNHLFITTVILNIA